MTKTLSILASLVVLAGCGGDQAHRAKTPEPARKVQGEVVAVELAQWPATYEATGTVRARAATAIASRVMGHVQQVNVSVGDRVKEGQVLVTVDARDLETGVRRAEAGQAEARNALPEVEHAIAGAKANLDLAQATFNRMEGLAAKKSVSTQELDEASARLKGAQAGYQMALARRAQLESKIAQAEEERQSARIMREYAEIRAPFAGVVTEKTVEPGTLASPGAPLFKLERDSGYRLEASVEESRIAAVRPGQTVEVALEGCTAPGRVAEIVPSVDAASRSYTVKIDLSCSNLRSGMFGRAAFVTGTRNVLTAPARAVTERGQLLSVMVVENGVPQSRLITVGARRGDRVEVLSGLQAGERVEVRQ